MKFSILIQNKIMSNYLKLEKLKKKLNFNAIKRKNPKKKTKFSQ